jgi:ribonucleotide monophosphatase NagD (HAD superfamily)
VIRLDEYKFTWSTKTFYKRRNSDDRTIRKVGKPSHEMFAFAVEVMQHSPNWVKDYYKENREYNKIVSIRDPDKKDKMLRKHIQRYHR